MTDRLSKDVEKNIADIFGEFNNKLGELASNIMNKVFKVGTAQLTEIQTNVSGYMGESTKTTKELNATYHSSVGVTTEKAPSLPTPTTPSIGRSGPSGPTGGFTPQ